ncbi:DUF4097 family beta strand repeat-containing protein [uncultured Fenollaria sp.]|uniref:DUF4097 family beta strand repeat-containing protein n=1 Tax=uncultured Fenollaria sp. TaxID=1686315 RepID=UPI002600284D|nr:DUF4097 family beta strand repeat-containing protein [uncultured Fenollaria sp.]
MKKKFYILLAFCLLMTFSVGCAQITIKRGDIDTGFTKSDYSKFQNKKSVTLKFDLDKNTKYDLEISNDCGNVELLPSSSDQLEVYGEVHYTDKKDISEDYEFIKCHVDDKLASIKANREKYKTNDFIVNLKVLVPEQEFAKVNINTSNDELVINSVKCEEFYLESRNAELKMNDSKIANSEISTSNGTVEIKDSNFTDIVINTSNAEIALNNTEFVNLEGNTSNGSIEVNDVSNIAEKMILTNSNGPINIDLSSVENDIKLNLLGLDSINCKANINESKYKLDEASGELSKIEANNDSEHTLIGEIETSNGDITIK